MSSSPFAPDEPMAELHAHLGGSVPTYVMWESAHAQGIHLPTRDYWEFDRMVSISNPRGVDGLDGLDQVYHVTELIQSSPLAVERCVHGMIGGGYRSQRITTCEVRFNPMKRNRGGERDLDHIILAAMRGLDRASLEYPQVRAGDDPDDGPDVHARAERDHRREGDPLRVARRGRHRHRRPAPRAAGASTTRPRPLVAGPATRGSA